jgi:hypothetical protein
MNLNMVLEPPHVCNTKNDFYGGKHPLEVDKMHFYLALITSPPDPLSTMEQSNSRQPYAERGKEIKKGLAERAPFSKKTSPPLMSCKRQWGRGKGVGENNSKPLETERSLLRSQ